MAKWSEDSVWYRARVMCRAAGSVVKVLFIDYGNEEEVDEKDIVKTLGDVPQNDYVDETADELLTSQIKSSKSPDMESKKQDPSNFRSVWMEGDLCVAKWKDGVWYRARIERVLGEDCYRVFFLDYHNDATVIGTEILKDRAEVPRGEYVDEKAAEKLTLQIKNSEKPDLESKKLDPSNYSSVWMEGDLCVAKWKDGVW